jgi:hypothetical protein
MYEKEEDCWHQRSRDTWLVKGDNYTEYFHRIANGHRRKKTIFSLQDGPRTIQGTPDLPKHATVFYKNMFGAQVNAANRLMDDMWSDRDQLNEEDGIELDKPFNTKLQVLMVSPLSFSKLSGSS